MAKYTKEEITQMADRCFHRCWHCDKYEPSSGTGSGGSRLFSYASSGCYEAHDLPWEHGHWCPFWGNKNHPDKDLLKSLTMDDVASYINATKISEPYDLREKILTANPEIAQQVKYCDNSNESRDQYFNKSENQAMFSFDKFNVYCETLRRYRFSHVDNRALYPGANEWIRPMVICYDKKTLKALAYYVENHDGIQISFACSPDKNYHLNSDIFLFNEETKQIIAEFRNYHDLIQQKCFSIKHLM